MPRRIQSIALMFALLAAPLALLSRSYACAPAECNMVCCRHAHVHAMNMNCHPGSAGTCICQSKKNLDYGLICPLPPTQLQVAFNLPPSGHERLFFFINSSHTMDGFSRVPFEPPRL
ncbi:MAG TPA: hypothetical protein VGU63_15750 [Candidatus Acidoferrales bacterium]|nr:hypothetical protein [Candidatus Acidoferrales bacterium]